MNDAETGVETDARLKRPAPARQAPLRRPPLGLPASMGATLNGALGAALDSGQAVSAGLGAAVRQGVNGGQALGEAVEAGVQGFVEGGVKTAYQVIEDYMRRGQQAAQRLSPPGPESARHGLAGDAANAVNAANAWAQNLAGPLSQGASSLAGPWLQLARAWVDGLSTLAPMAGQALGQVVGQAGDLNRAGVLHRFTGQGTAAPSAEHSAAPSIAPAIAPATAAFAAAPGTGPRAKVTLEFMSSQAANVAVTLEPGADLAALQAHWVGQAGSSETAVVPGSLMLYSAPGHVHVRLTLAQPPMAGRHLASVTDSQGQSWGEVSVVIAERAESQPKPPTT